MKLHKLALILLLSFSMKEVLAATTSSGAQPANTVYNEDKTNIVVTAQQPQFTIHLKSNPTTGYSWFLREYDSNLVTPVKHNYTPGEKNLIGSGGYEDWVFKMKPAAFTVPHETVIRMVYARPWDTTDTGTMVLFRVSTQ